MPLKRDCDICKMFSTKTPALYDAKTLAGPWAYLCQHHMDTEGHPNYKSIAKKLSEVK